MKVGDRSAGRAPADRSARADLRHGATAWLVGSLLMVACWLLVGGLQAWGAYGDLVISDVPVYLSVARGIVGGGFPYRDLPLEYPPLALPAFLLPALGGVAEGADGAYVANFELLMLACGSVAIAAVLVGLHAVHATPGRTAVAVGLVATSPLLVGPVMASRYDLWPAALLAAALAAALIGRLRLAGLVLGLATMAKLYPLLVLPILVVAAWKRSGRGEALFVAAISLATIALIAVPFAVASPSGVLRSVAEQLQRPLQIESLGSVTLIVVHALTDLGISVETSFGSQNLAGGPAGIAATLSAIAVFIAVASMWAWFARGPASGRRLTRASAAVVVAAVAFGKVLSPQYVIWLIPLVPLVTGRRGIAAMAALAAALLLTSLYFPSRYFDLPDRLDAGTAGIVLLRDLTLVSLFLVLVLPWSAMARRVRSTAASIDARWHLSRRRPSPQAVLGLVLLVSLFLRILWLNLPDGSLIFDETYYVNAARVMLGWPVGEGAPYAGAPALLDPNQEHPPLGKALMAASMAVFGDQGIGWRLPSVVAGMLGLLAVYGIVRAAGGRPWLGVLAVTIYSLDILSFVHGRIGTLDMLSVALMLVGAWLGLRRRWILAGAMLGLATLIKLPSAYGLLAALIWQAIVVWLAYRRGDRLDWRAALPTVSVSAAFAVVFLVGLWLLDLRFTTHANPFDHIRGMLSYGFGLQPRYDPDTIASAPWEWLVNGGQHDYLRIDVNLMVDDEVVGSSATVQFRALLNPVLIGTATIVVLYAAWLAWRRRDRVSRWALIWMAANYLPYWGLVLVSNRITYLYYMLPVVPGLAVATAVLLFHARLPRLVTWGYLGAMALAFAASFPFRTLP